MEDILTGSISTIVAILLIKALKLLPFAILLVLLKYIFGRFARAWWGRSLRTDLGYMCLSFFYGPLMRHFITLILAVFALEAGVFSQDNVGFAGLPFVIQLIILLLLQDLLIFVRHRVFDGKNLWRFHSIHHSSTEVNWLSSYRFHPVESLIEAALNIILFMLIGPSQDVLIVAALIIGFNNLFIHSDCPFAARFCKPSISPLAPLQ